MPAALSRRGRIRALAEPLGTILLALGYGAAIIGIANLESGKRLLGWAAPLGRMAFTNYLAQSVIFGWIFYGYGLGLFGRLGVTSALAIGVAVYIGQVFFSAWWLRRYRYGPVEWLWRTLMYGAAQPMCVRLRRAMTILERRLGVDWQELEALYRAARWQQERGDLEVVLATACSAALPATMAGWSAPAGLARPRCAYLCDVAVCRAIRD